MSEDGSALPTAREQLNGLSFGMLLLSPDHVIQEANPSAENLLGMSFRRMQGKSFLDNGFSDQGMIGDQGMGFIDDQGKGFNDPGAKVRSIAGNRPFV